MVFVINLARPSEREIKCKEKLKKLAKENEITMTSFLLLLIEQIYDLEYPNKGRDYKEWIKEWREKNGIRTNPIR